MSRNDKRTLRLLGPGAAVPDLSYPVGKIVGLTGGLVDQNVRWMILDASRNCPPPA